MDWKQKATEISYIFRTWDVQRATAYGCYDMAEYLFGKFQGIIEKVRRKAWLANHYNKNEYEEKSDDYWIGYTDALISVQKHLKELKKGSQ